jgi:tetratricopeptide (TPR) repeat protein
MRVAGRRLLIVFSALLLASHVGAQARFTDADAESPDAGLKLVVAAAAEKRIADAVELLERYAPRLAPGEGKKSALEALARLQEMAGNYAGAAESWLVASSAGPSDPDAVFSAVRCLIAVGESPRAIAELDSLAKLLSDPAVSAKAALHKAYAGAFLREAGAAGDLRSFAVSDSYAGDRPTILFLLARLYGDRAAAERLSAEFPASPEAGVLASGGVRLAAGPHWFIAADRSAVVLKAGETEKGAEEEKPQPSAAGPTALQVGLFREEKNARTLAERLTAKGFSVSVSPRTVGAATHHAVTVDPGASAEETAMRLKDAGFESYPLF